MDYICNKYGKNSPKYLCPVENDALDCKDCIWSSLVEDCSDFPDDCVLLPIVVDNTILLHTALFIFQLSVLVVFWYAVTELSTLD